MRSGARAVALLGLTGFLSSHSPAQDACSRLAVGGVRLGMTADDVREALRMEGAMTQVVLPDGRRATVEAFTLPDGVLQVEYDGIAGRGSEARVAFVRQPLRQTFDAVNALTRRLGVPVSGRDELVQGLRNGPAVWIDTMCDAVLSFYRRNESWLVDDVPTFVRVERLSRLPDESPARVAVQEFLASGSPPPAAPVVADDVPSDRAIANAPPVEPIAEPAMANDSPPRRSGYVPPTYPAGAKQLGVHGVVTVHLVVAKTGRVADATITAVEPKGYGFEAAALAAAKRWDFFPATRDGRPVDGEVDIVIRFR